MLRSMVAESPVCTPLDGNRRSIMADYKDIPGLHLGHPDTWPEHARAAIKSQMPTTQAQDSQPQMTALSQSANLGTGESYYSDGQKFRGGILFSGSAPIIDHAKTRANARRAYHDSLPAQAIVNRFAQIVVGDGIRIEPKPRAEILGITQQAAERWSRDYADRFDMYASSRQVSLRNDQNLYQMQYLAEKEARRDGEYFKRFYYLNEPGRISPLAIDNIEQSQIVGNAYTNTSGLPWTNDGINRDKYGREVSYQVRARQSNGSYKTITVAAMIGSRRQFIHGFTPDYAGQGRGFSVLHNSLQELSQWTNMSIATVQKAIIQASIVMSKETDAGSAATGNPFDLDGVAGVTPMFPAQPNASALDDDSTPAADSFPDYRPVDVALSPGGISIFNNGPGEKLKAFTDTAPSDQFAPFTASFLGIICAAQNMPYEVFLQEFNSNYTAARAALIQVYRYARILKGEHVSDFLSEVQLAWTAEEIAAGRISAPGWQDPILRAAWLSANWHGPQMPDIDPTKTIKASKDATEAHITNIALEAQKFNGTDASSNRAINERILDGAQSAHWNPSKFGPGGPDETPEEETEEVVKPKKPETTETP